VSLIRFFANRRIHMNNDNSTLRELASDEIETISGGVGSLILPNTLSAPVFSGEFLGFINAGDRDPRQHLINSQLQAAYAANPGVPRIQVYADFFNL
jgi:hypothetical protein